MWWENFFTIFEARIVNSRKHSRKEWQQIYAQILWFWACIIICHSIYESRSDSINFIFFAPNSSRLSCFWAWKVSFDNYSINIEGDSWWYQSYICYIFIILKHGVLILRLKLRFRFLIFVFVFDPGTTLIVVHKFLLHVSFHFQESRSCGIVQSSNIYSFKANVDRSRKTLQTLDYAIALKNLYAIVWAAWSFY